MPPNKKKGGRNNNKKSKNRGRHQQNQQQQVPGGAGRASTGINGELPSLPDHSYFVPLRPQDFPKSWENFGNATERDQQPLDQRFQTIYDRYKKATDRFKDAIFCMASPISEKVKGKKTATDLMDAADYVVKNATKIDSEVIADLKLAI